MTTQFTKRSIFILLLASTFLMVTVGCSRSRYRQPKKPHNSYRSGKKNKWMDEKRRNMQQF